MRPLALLALPALVASPPVVESVAALAIAALAPAGFTLTTTRTARAEAIGAPSPGAATLPGPGQPGPGGHGVRFSFTDLRGGGSVRCALYNSDGDHMKRSFAETMGRVEGGRAQCVFSNVAPGVYSGGAFHDANDNGKLDTNWIGIPKEGVASSNNAKGRMGPPKFKDASFEYKGGLFTQDLRMKYF
ncbi:MAG: DUF2141 domain-containing protein [Polyangia bacterium]